MQPLLVPAGNPGPFSGSGNNTYLIVGTDAVLVDAGVGEPSHLDAVARALAGRPLARVLVTHGHPDHASGAPAIARRWPDCQFVKMPWPEVDGRYGAAWRPARDGDVIPAGDEYVRAVHTPGHAPDHLCFFHDRSGTLFGGDLLVQGRTVVIPATRGGNLVRYLESLARVQKLSPKRVLPAHGPAIEAPATLIAAYVEHRRDRERQILSALGAGPANAAAIVERVYEGLPPELAEAARETVLAHLVKLEAEHRVLGAGDRWRLCRCG